MDGPNCICMSDPGTWWAALERAVSVAVHGTVSGHHCVSEGGVLLAEHTDLLSLGVFRVQTGYLSEEVE